MGLKGKCKYNLGYHRRKGVSDILYSLSDGPKKFSQLMFDTKLNPSILDRHLKVLLKVGLVIKEDKHYKLTESGTKVVETIDDLLELFKKSLG
nr:ArsR family transcriptional regulator [Archaeoglobus fulgidus]